jgi:hypothetical protein
MVPLKNKPMAPAEKGNSACQIEKLDAVAEEAVNAVYAGHCFHHMPRLYLSTLDFLLSVRYGMASNNKAHAREDKNAAIALNMINQSIRFRSLTPNSDEYIQQIHQAYQY